MISRDKTGLGCFGTAWADSIGSDALLSLLSLLSLRSCLAFCSGGDGIAAWCLDLVGTATGPIGGPWLAIETGREVASLASL